MTSTPADQRPDPVPGRWTHDDPLIADTAADGQGRVAVYAHPGVACVIGRGGDPQVETHQDRLADDGVPLLRRHGGGCAVVLDPGNLVCSVVLPWPGVGGITTAFAELSAMVARSLAACGLPGVRQQGTSDLALGNRKLGGSCIWRTRGLLYYSTTLLVDPVWSLIDRYLPHPPREPAYRAGRSHREFLTSVREAGLDAPLPALAAALGADLAPTVADLASVRR